MTFRRSAVSRLLTLSVLLALVVGCGNPKPPPGEVTINKLATWFQYYRQTHRGKSPKNEEELIAFIEKEFEGAPNPPDLEQMFTSERDGQRYIVMYGVKQLDKVDLEKNLACYEAEGYEGNVMVAFEQGGTEEVDQAGLEALLEQYDKKKKKKK